LWQRAVATFLVIGSVLIGVQASEVVSTPAPDLPGEFASPYQSYSLKLAHFCPVPNRPAGVLLKVRINGGRPLRLVLDSGADLIVIGAKAARSAGISGESATDLVGLGSRPAKVGLADTVDIGPVSFRNCRVGFVKGQVVEGADGVVPLSLFSAFRLRLDLPRHRLELIPYSGEQSPAIRPVRDGRRHNLLMITAVLNGKRYGYVVLDTAAFCSGVSLNVARTLIGSPMMPGVPLAAGTGATAGQRVSSLVQFAIAKQSLIPREVVAMDLSNVSRHYGLEVMGVLGFPALSNYVLTVDYHDGWVKIEPPQSHSSPEPHGSDNAQLSPLAYR
jgi:Aspartyl protease